MASIGEASRILGISEATLRQWTDEGLIKAFVTPGGHRRFSKEQLDEFISSHQKMLGIKDLVTKLEGTAEPHREIGATFMLAFASHNKLDSAQKQHLAALGRRILDLIINYVAESGQRAEAVRLAREVGSDFGITLAGAGLTLVDSIQAFTSHRQPIMESVVGMMRQRETLAEGIFPAISLIDNIMDQALVALVEAYQQKARPAQLKSKAGC
ncbi:MAG: helix-turn-helix domain-containing protein [Dehalococcoidales bacterium]